MYRSVHNKTAHETGINQKPCLSLFLSETNLSFLSCDWLNLFLQLVSSMGIGRGFPLGKKMSTPQNNMVRSN